MHNYSIETGLESDDVQDPCSAHPSESSGLLAAPISPLNYRSLDIEHLEDATAPTSESLVSFVDVFKKVSALAIPMGLSFTFSFEVFLAVLLLQLLSESEEDTAAATLVSTWMNTVCVLFMAPLFAVAVDLSGKLGAWREEARAGHQSQENNQLIVQIWSEGATREDKKEKIESTNINSLMIASAVTVPTVLLLVFAKPILVTVFGQNTDVAHAAQKFLTPYAIAVPGLMARMSLEQVMFSFGKAHHAMWMALSSFAIGGSLSALLGFGIKIGSLVISRMNQEGVALGFVAESYLTALAYGLFIKFNNECREFDFYKTSLEKIRRNLDELKNTLRLGAAITFTVAIELALTLSIGVFSGLVGTISQSAMSYCMQFIYFEFIFIAAFGFSCTQEIRRAVGANRNNEAELIGKYGLLTTLIYLAPLPVFFAAYPRALEAISGGVSENVAQILNWLVPIMSVGVILDALRYNMLQQTRALNDLLVPNTLALVGMSSGIGISAGLGLGTDLGIYGVGAGYTIGIGLTAVALLIRWLMNWSQLSSSENDSILSQGTQTRETVLNCCYSLFSRIRGRQNTIEAIEESTDDKETNHGLLKFPVK